MYPSASVACLCNRSTKSFLGLVRNSEAQQDRHSRSIQALGDNVESRGSKDGLFVSSIHIIDKGVKVLPALEVYKEHRKR